MSHQLPDKYWDLLGHNSPFQHELFCNQSQFVAQLQETNNNLQARMMDVPDNVANAASQAALALARTILTNAPVPTGGQQLQNTKLADPEPLDGSL